MKIFRILTLLTIFTVFSFNILLASDTKIKTVVMGDELKITCNNLNDIARVEWFKDGVPLDNFSGDQIVIRSAKISDAGVYHAVVDGVCGITRTNDLLVKIEVPYQPGIETAVAGGDFLFQNEPNPASDRINFKFSLSKAANTKLVLYDTFGKEIAVIFDGLAMSGLNTFEFSASNFNLANGVYFYSLMTPEFKETKSLLLVK